MTGVLGDSPWGGRSKSETREGVDGLFGGFGAEGALDAVFEFGVGWIRLQALRVFLDGVVVFAFFVEQVSQG